MSALKLCLASAVALFATGCKLRGSAQEEASSVFSVNDSNGCVAEGVQEDKVRQDAQLNPTAALADPSKAAVLLYYGVDSAEPFMVHTVDHEVRDLKAACEFRRKGKGSSVNFIVFLNSYYVAEPAGAGYAMCKDGKLSTHVLPAEVSGWLAQKRELFTRADINWDQAGGPLRSGKLRYLMRYPVEDEVIRTAYRNYPFAHPDFFALLFDHMRQLFPPAQYTYFVHMKSHGSDQLLLTGLTGTIETAKEECQKKLWDKSMAELAADLGGGAGSAGGTLAFKPTRPAGAGVRGPDDEMYLTLIGLGDSTVARIPVCLLRVGPHKDLFGEIRVESGARLADLEFGEKRFCDWRFGELSAPPVSAGESAALGDVRLGDVRLGDVRLGDARLGDVRLGDVRLGDVRLGDVRLGDVRLGDARLGDVRLGDSRLGSSRLGVDGGPFAGAGLGNAAGSGLGTFRLGNDGGHLGVTGLGAGNHFGMPSYALNGVLVDLIKNLKRTPDEAATEVAFLMLESCDSKMVSKDPIARHLLTLVPELKAYYSAKGSLWYRNLDWDDIFMEWQMDHEPPTAGALQARLLGEVKQFVNYVPK